MKAKKYLAFILVFALIVGAHAVWASGGPDAAGGAAPEITIYINGKILATDSPAIIVGERTMVPLRAVSEAIGCKVDWFEDDMRVVINTPVREDPFMELRIDDYNVKVTMHDYSGGGGGGTSGGGSIGIGSGISVNSSSGSSGSGGGIPERWIEETATDTPPTIINGRTYLPLRFVSEWMGFTVRWDESEWAVYLDNRTSDAEIANRIAGTWHIMNFISAGYGKRYAFNPDGTYIFGADTATGSFGNGKGGYIRELFRTGKWKIVGGRLVLLPEKHLMAESAFNMNSEDYGGGGMDGMFDAEYSLRLLESSAPTSYTVTFLGSDPESGRESVIIDYETFYAYGNQQGLMDQYHSLIKIVGDGILERDADGYRVMEDIFYDRTLGKIMPYAGGVLQKASFYHDGMDEYLSFYFVEIGPGQYKHLTGSADTPVTTFEIQVYSSTYNLEPYVGKFFEFWGEHFEAHTIHHRRDIVMEITQIRQEIQ